MAGIKRRFEVPKVKRTLLSRTDFFKLLRKVTKNGQLQKVNFQA